MSAPGTSSSGSDAATQSRSIYWDVEVAERRVLVDGPVAELLGLEVAGAGGELDTWLERLHPEDQTRVRGEIEALVAGTSERWDGGCRLRHDAGGFVAFFARAVSVRHAGRAHRIVGVLRPVSAPESPRVRESTLLARLEHGDTRFATFVESLPLLAWEADAEGWIYFYNERWYEFTGTTPKEMEGWGWVLVHDPLDLPRILKVWRQALRTGRPWEDEFKLRRGSDGMLRWHLSRALPLRDASGRVVRWFGTNTDIHDQKMALRERERLLAAETRLRREAEAASREKDEFLAVVSHELRTPLNAVLGWAQLLRRGAVDAARSAAAVERIERSARLLGSLIDDLLDVSRIISGKLDIEREPVDAVVAVRNAVEALRPQAEKKDVLIETTGAGAAMVEGSVDRLQQVVSNLISNAIKFSAQGGRVEVDVATGREVVIRVRDHGAGIDREFLPQLFRRFRQADSSSRRSHGGLGLGLSIVRHLVERHGGRVSGESDGPGTGATFTVVLPLLQGAAAPAPRPSEVVEAEPVSLTGIRVLGVDDDAETLEVLANVLLSCGATVTLARSVAEAVEALRLDVADVVISDISMPEVDGYGLVARLRASSDPRVAGLPIVALTAYASLQDREHALAGGFDDYVSKPFEVARLSRVVAELVRAREVES